MSSHCPLSLVCQAVMLHLDMLWKRDMTALDTVCRGPCPCWWTHPPQSQLSIIPCSKCIRNYTHPHQHTDTHTHFLHPLQHTATYIWCKDVQWLSLAQTRQPPADSAKFLQPVTLVDVTVCSLVLHVCSFSWHSFAVTWTRVGAVTRQSYMFFAIIRTVYWCAAAADDGCWLLAPPVSVVCCLSFK